MLKIIVLLLCLVIRANALPINQSAIQSIEELPTSFTAGYNFEGIAGLSNCSGSLVRFEHSQDSDQAMILSNGHCVQLHPAGSFIYRQASNRRFALFNDAAVRIATVSADQLMYSTLTKTDMSIYRLVETYAQIISKYGIRPLTLASKRSQINDPIEVISGYWVKGYSCSIDRIVNKLKESDWTWENSIRYSITGCETIHGTSGSPIISAGTRTVVGVNNTGNDSGERCTMDNPCEVDEAGNIYVEKGRSYGQQIDLLYSCINPKLEFDISTPNCQLPH